MAWFSHHSAWNQHKPLFSHLCKGNQTKSPFNTMHIYMLHTPWAGFHTILRGIDASPSLHTNAKKPTNIHVASHCTRTDSSLIVLVTEFTF